MATGKTYGTNYGGWWLPDNLELDANSLIISAGVGEDISFDLAIQSKTGCNVELIDPTERAVKHFEEIVAYYRSKDFSSLTGSIQKDYELHISPLNPDFEKIHMNCVGLWSEDTTLKFYKQVNPNYVSQTLIHNMYGANYSLVLVKRLKNFLLEKDYDPKKIDVLKLDIEGAEMEVLQTLLDDEIYPKVLCIEFDYYLKGLDINGTLTKRLIKELASKGYKALHNANWNITFCRDVA
jgi:FkbM family methyltransferase